MHVNWRTCLRLPQDVEFAVRKGPVGYNPGPRSFRRPLPLGLPALVSLGALPVTNRVYLDMCCFKRPFDDQRDARVREEAAAVASLIARAESGRLVLVRSPAHLVENDANPREDRRIAAALWIDRATVTVEQTPEIEARAVVLAEAGYPPLDALHVAFAEAAGARWFVTCDDRLLKLAARRVADVKTPVVTPGAVLAEETGEER